MKYLIDTNICIHFFRGRYDLYSKFQDVGVENCAISEIALAELIFAAENSSNPEKNFQLIEQLTDLVIILPIIDAVYIYGKEKARLRSAGTIISDLDLLIGCSAVEKDLTMVTENVNEFERLSDLKIENWIDR